MYVVVHKFAQQLHCYSSSVFICCMGIAVHEVMYIQDLVLHFLEPVLMRPYFLHSLIRLPKLNHNVLFSVTMALGDWTLEWLSDKAITRMLIGGLLFIYSCFTCQIFFQIVEFDLKRNSLSWEHQYIISHPPIKVLVMTLFSETRVLAGICFCMRVRVA